MRAKSAAVEAWACVAERNAIAYVMKEGIATSAPAGKPKPSTRRTKPGRARSLLGGRDRMKAGTPMVNQPVIVTWIGWKGASTAKITVNMAMIAE